MRSGFVGRFLIAAALTATSVGCDVAGRSSEGAKGAGNGPPALGPAMPPGGAETRGKETAGVDPGMPAKNSPPEARPPQTAKRTMPPKSIPPRRPGPDSKALVGKSEAELASLLGPPNDVRNEPPAVVWSYRAQACSLDVFLYFDVAQNGFRSLAYRFYPETRMEEVERACLAGIRNEETKSPGRN